VAHIQASLRGWGDSSPAAAASAAADAAAVAEAAEAAEAAASATGVPRRRCLVLASHGRVHGRYCLPRHKMPSKSRDEG